MALALAVLAGCSAVSPRPASSLAARPAPTTVSANPPGDTTTDPATTTAPAPTSTATSRPPAPPYPVGEATVTLVDPSRPTVSAGRAIAPTRTLTTTVWYPQVAGRWPLVVFAHGFQVGPATYAALLEAWAAHGYVVAAPAFPLTDEAVAGTNLDESDIQNQPADVRFVTDQLISATSPVISHIDPSRVAVAGHSDGAETALAAATDAPPAGAPAYRAALILAGQPVPGVAGHNPPMLVAQGDADDINPPSYGYAVWQQAASPKYLLVMRGAGHLPGFQPGPWLPGVEAVTETFLDAYLAGDATGAAISARAAGNPYLSIRSG